MILWGLVLLVGLAVLVKSSDWFSHAAEALGRGLGVSPIVIGVTVVSIGTSLPELASSIVAVADGASGLVLGNVLGSNVANVLLVLAAGAVLGGGLSFQAGRYIDWPFLLGSVPLIVLVVADGAVTLGESLVLLLVYALYMVLLVREMPAGRRRRGRVGRQLLILAASGVVVYLGARMVVDAAVRLAAELGVSESAIAASVIAVGTSVPELAVTVVAAWKGRQEIAFGNIVGSCIFNLLVVVGAAGLFGTIEVARASLGVLLGGLVVATLVLLGASYRGRLSRVAGVALLVGYAAFLVLLF